MDGAKPCAHCMVGQVWLHEAAEDKNSPIALRVAPKTDADSTRMYSRCASDPMVRNHLNKLVTLFWDEPPIPAGELSNEITPLIIGRYLTLLYDLCQKHLRGLAQPVEENLSGRVRGRPLVRQTIRRNLWRGRADRVFCRYQSHSIDTSANQILLAALRQGLKCLDEHLLKTDGLARIAAFSADALNGVTLR